MAVQREAEIAWQGDVQNGRGNITLATSGAGGQFPISLPTRTQNPEGQTSPEELLAASHAGCYAMALSMVLTQDGTPPEALDASAEVALDQQGGGYAVTRSDLTVRGRVPGVSEQAFQDAAQRAEQACPISNAIRGNATITVDAALEAA